MTETATYLTSVPEIRRALRGRTVYVVSTTANDPIEIRVSVEAIVEAVEGADSRLAVDVDYYSDGTAVVHFMS